MVIDALKFGVSMKETSAIALICAIFVLISGCSRNDPASMTGETYSQQAGPVDNTPALGAATGGDDNSAPSTDETGAVIGGDGNLAPSIEAISLGCDLVLDTISVSVGQSASFTLLVDDESPLTLTYSIISDDESVSQASVDADGVFVLNGLKTGTTTMPIAVTDEKGRTDNVLLSVVVRA